MAGLFNAEVTEKIRKGLCLFLEESDELFEWIAVQIFGKEVGEDITESEEGQLGLLQRLLGRGVCDKALDWEPVVPPIPFEGGQCSNRNYQLQYNISYTDFTGIQRDDQIGFLSPILGGKIVSASIFIGEILGNRCRIDATAANENGDTFTTEINFSARNPDPNLSVNFIRFVSINGVDDCGNPRPKITKDTPPEITTDIEYEDENGVPQVLNNTVFILGDVNISPDGNVSIGFNNSDLQLQGDINIFPQYGVTYRNPLVKEEIPVKKFNEQGEGTEIPESSLSESEEVEEIPEDSLPIVAVVVKTQKESFARLPYTFIPNGEAPQLIVPRVAWVSFKIRKGDTTAWTQPIDVKTVDGYVLCEEPEGAIAYSVQWARGWKGKSYAILGLPLSELVCCKEQATPISGS